MLVQDAAVLEHAVIHVKNGLIMGIDHGEADVDLGDVAAVPGCVNAHSHTFQRAIRGRTEYLDSSRVDDDFWSWRKRMYAVALRLSPEELHVVSKMAFLEMIKGG